MYGLFSNSPSLLFFLAHAIQALYYLSYNPRTPHPPFLFRVSLCNLGCLKICHTTPLASLSWACCHTPGSFFCMSGFVGIWEILSTLSDSWVDIPLCCSSRILVRLYAGGQCQGQTGNLRVTNVRLCTLNF